MVQEKTLAKIPINEYTDFSLCTFFKERITMKKMVSGVLVAAFLTVSSLAFAAEQKVVGVIEKISVQGATATVILKDNKGGAKVEVVVKDQLTLDKLKDKRIVVGDEVRVKYDDANKESKLFRKTAGC